MVNVRLLILVSLFCAGCAWIGLNRLEISTDVLQTLPAGEKVLADGLTIFKNHPIHDQIAVDVAVDRDDGIDLLVTAGDELTRRMRESGLFSRVGMGEIGERIPELAGHAAKALPFLFSAQELEGDVAPLLAPERIGQRIQQLRDDLTGLAGIGQAGFIGADPLGLKDRVMARLAPLAPSSTARMHQGHLLSADGRHLLVVARPRASGTDGAAARELAAFFETASREIAAPAPGQRITLTPVGSYRAALDNETLIRRDVRLAVGLSTAGIALLLLFSFPRPLLGLLSLVPALAGTAGALFVYSLFHRSISVMALGFSGAVISMTADYGIAYLLFLDQPRETDSRATSREVCSISILTQLTTIGAFLVLGVSGFPIMTEVGRFTALGQAMAFGFIHFVFPRVLPVMPPGSSRALPLRKLINRLYGTGKAGLAAAGLLAVGLAFFAKPHFQISLSSMNTVSQATRAADELFGRVWGNFSGRIFLMATADSPEDLRRMDDRLLALVEEDLGRGVLDSGFSPSMIFPGPERAADNLAAWRRFWTPERIAEVSAVLAKNAEDNGFAPDAFADFTARLAPAAHEAPPTMPERFHELLGISIPSAETRVVRFATLTPGKGYDATTFLARYGDGETVFDPQFFSEWMARYLFSTFKTMLLLVCAGMSLVMFFSLLHPTLTLLSLLPPAFAMVCTLGTLKLLGQPFGIPALMLSVIVLGTGIDYGILCLRAHQRYRDMAHPSYALARSAAFLAGSSALIGFGALCFAEHSMLRAVGLAAMLGIGFCLAGTFLLLPPLLAAYFEKTRPDCPAPGRSVGQRVLRRFRSLEAHPRVFARCKLAFDPMFGELPRMLAGAADITTILDIGCGYGIPACWCLETFPAARVHGLEPDPERVRVASLVLAERGTVSQGLAPDLPPLPAGTGADLVLLLDMLHYLDDATVDALLQRCFAVLRPGGRLVMRVSVPPPGRPSWMWRLENFMVQRSGRGPWFRPMDEAARRLEAAGFTLTVTEASANPELAWLVGLAAKGGPDA